MDDSRTVSPARYFHPGAPSLWHRRLTHLVARRWNVELERKGNLSEGMLDGRRIAIRCAKSKTPPISVSASALERVHEVWGVFLTQTDAAQVYSLPAQEFKRLAYFYSPRNGQATYTLRLKRFSTRATLLGTIGEAEVEAIDIP